MQTRFFVLVTVSDKPSNQMNHKIGGTAMPGMLNLRNGLELVNNGLNDGPFTQQEPIGETHKLVCACSCAAG